MLFGGVKMSRMILGLILLMTMGFSGCGITSDIIKKLHISLVALTTRETEALVKAHTISVLILLK